jgi:sorting nexin-29
MEPYVEEIFGEYQSGFRQGQSTIDQICSSRIIIQKVYEYNVDIHQPYVDYKQAYDSINKAQLIEIMKDFGVPDKLVRLVKMTLESTNNKVKVQGKMSPSFQTAAGFRHGDSLSTLLFNLSM